MNTTGLALVGLASWAIILSLFLVTVRVNAIRSGKALNSFDPAGKDLEGFSYRMTRVHANMLENLPILASFLLYALATGQSAVTAGLAVWLLYARLAQSVVHMISTSVPFVMMRATLFSAQQFICLYWAWQFWHA